MLSSLIIENYAIIDKLEISFEKGFSVITGETGAGKSIMLGALGLVLGQRADLKTIKDGANKCIIEASFHIGAYSLEPFFNQYELDYDSLCIIRREILSSGKSRSFVNDTPIALSALKELGIQLIDVHSQHENLLLNDKHFQLNIVDVFAKSEKERSNYQLLYKKHSLLKEELTTLKERAATSNSDKEYLQFQFEQLATAKLETGEKENLEKELKQLSHSEEIKIELTKLEQLLADETSGIVLQLKESINAIQRITDYISTGKEISERLNSSYIDLKDLTSEVEVLQNDIEFNPEKLDRVNQRLDTIYTLEQKHRVDGTDALLTVQQEIEEKLILMDSFEDKIEKLEKELEKATTELTTASAKLTTKRTAGSREIPQLLIPQLHSLGMKNVQFQVLISKKHDFSETGNDQIDFMFSANDKASMRAVSQIASGGEISRLMLSLKSLIADIKELPCIIFDEIDTGVSGEIADKMATIMEKMSKKTQVICITHLPQIGAKGNFHYRVYKESSTTKIKRLNESERITEIALMLSGSKVSDAAIENAKALLTKC